MRFSRGTITSLVFAGQMFLFYALTNAAPQLMAHWSFDSTSGKTYYDVTGHGYDAVGTGDSIGITCDGIIGKALNCTGRGFDIPVNNSVDNFALAAFTIEAWVYSYVNLVNPGSWYNWHSIFDNAMPGLSLSGIRGGYVMEVTDCGRPNFSLSNLNGSDWIFAQSDTMIVSDQWHHVCAAYDGAVMKLYVNGVLKGQTAYSGGIKPNLNKARIATQFQVFDAAGTTGQNRNWFIGKIDELKLYGYALPADSIGAHYNTVKFYEPVLIPCTPRHTCDRRPHMRWHPVHCSDAYTIQINTTPSFTCPIKADSAADTSYSPDEDLPIGEIYWRVRAHADHDSYSLPETLWIESSTAVQEIAGSNRLPVFIAQPRNGIAVTYSLEKQGTVSLDVFSLAGNRIATVYAGSVSGGSHSILWNGTDRQHKLLPNGSYLAAFKINGRTFTKVIMLTR